MRGRPSTIDASGNINLHLLEDLYVPVLPQDGKSLAGRTLSFEFPALNLRFPLVAHPSMADARLISITAAQLRTVKTGTEFALVDRTLGSRVKWTGILKRFS